MSQLAYHRHKKFKLQKSLSILELSILILNVALAAKDPDIGFCDADRTLEELLSSLNFTFPIQPDALESALWSCNILDEKGKFFHPFGGSFDNLLKRIGLLDRFDKRYNMIKEI